MSSSSSSTSHNHSKSHTHVYDHFINPNELEDLDLNLPIHSSPHTHRKQKKDSKTNATTGASAAGVRAFTAQAVAFYFRAPVKAFFRTRVDYMVYARSVSQEAAAAAAASAATATRWRALWRGSTMGMLTHTVRTQGWRVVPEQVLPPLVANVFVGAVLYTSYLQILGQLHEPSGQVLKRVYPPPSPGETFTAGFLAGGIQSIVAAPLDALMVRYERQHFLSGANGNGTGTVSALPNHKTMVHYGREKLREIGVRGIFAGWGLSFMKDSLGSGVFFSVFEYVKAQGYYKYVRWYYGSLKQEVVDLLARKRPDHDHKATFDSYGDRKTIIKPHYALEPSFLLLAGISATLVQQGVLFPLTMIQQRHFERLEELDAAARKIYSTDRSHRTRGRMLQAYMNAYQNTLRGCIAEAKPFGGLRKWLYRGFWWNTIRQVPSTSAGLIIFELVRRKYGLETEDVRIRMDGYDILLK